VVGSGLILVTTFIIPDKLQVLTVSSGSMLPSIPVGSLILDLPKGEYLPGEIITFRCRDGNFENEALVTHRVAAVIKNDDGIVYKTKGDRNDSVDLDPVTENQIVGRVIFSLPLAGHAVLFSQTSFGFFLLVILPAAVIIYREVLNLRSGIRDFYAKKKASVIPPAESAGCGIPWGERTIQRDPHVVPLSGIPQDDRNLKSA